MLRLFCLAVCSFFLFAASFAHAQTVTLRPRIEANGPAVLLYGHAEPYGEPIVSYGPFVMNTEDEIRQAIRDYQAGKFNQPVHA